MRTISKITLGIALGIGAVGVVAFLAIVWLIVVLYPPKTTELLQKTMQGSEFTAVPTESAAIAAVQKRTEVVKYVFELSKLGKNAEFRAEDRGDVWAVQVFEVVDKGESSHTATFNWYSVNKRTGTVEPDFSFTDS